ncbi:Hypothetical_protein [Hexamita inflata]|uniref:Hypothetical_protein n=1 Tax=Hexamita inflata TaxID=28002 RepID=A0AA86UHS9_9EUKA|nr:Hypothetical protein HINF_LOCUS28293 [Hexamita inflata]
MRPRRASKIKSSEKTSEFRFQDFQQTSEYSYIHLSQSIRVSQLALIDFEEFSFLSRNPAVEADENSEIFFKFREVDLEPVSPILAGSTYHSQSHPSRKRAALSRSLSKVTRVSFYDNYINVYLLHITSVSHIPLLTNEDDQCQQKETAPPLILVRMEWESTACFRQTSAVGALVSTVKHQRLKQTKIVKSISSFVRLRIYRSQLLYSIQMRINLTKVIIQKQQLIIFQFDLEQIQSFSESSCVSQLVFNSFDKYNSKIIVPFLSS